jgi:proline dehydrogenase
MLRRFCAFVARQPLLRKVIVTTPVVRDLAWRFVAGEDLSAGLAAVRALNARGIKGTLNYVGTHVRDEAEASAAADEAVLALRRIADERVDTNLSLKLTQIGLDIDDDLCRAQLRRVLDCARSLGNFVRIDMEESPYVERTLRLFEEAKADHGADTVGIVIQSYLRQRAGDLEKLVATGARVRLVKGGYWEPGSVVYQKKADIDGAFLRDAELLLARGHYPALASHDARFLAAAQRLAAALRRDRRDYEFQMLYGVRRDLQEDLTRQGHTVRCYVPYGGQWYAYFVGCVRRVLGGMLGRFSERTRPGHRAPASYEGQR